VQTEYSLFTRNVEPNDALDTVRASSAKQSFDRT
jgi:hypothetical protein